MIPLYLIGLVYRRLSLMKKLTNNNIEHIMLAYGYLKRLRLNCYSFYLRSFHLCDCIILLISLLNVISNLFISLQPCLLVLCHDHWLICLTLPTIIVATSLYFQGLIAKYHSSDRN